MRWANCKIGAIMFGGGQQRVVPLRLHPLAHGGAGVVVGHHLRQQAVAQAQRQIAEAAQLAKLHQLGKNHGAGDDDFGAARADAGQRAPLRQIALAQFLPAATRRQPGHGVRLALVIAAHLGGVQAGQSRRRSRGRDRDLQLGVDDSLLDARDFALNDAAHLLQLHRATADRDAEMSG